MTAVSHEWETERLMARRAVPDTAPQIFEAYAQDPEVARYMVWRPHRDVHETVAFLERCERVRREGTAFLWTLWLKDDGSLAGMIDARVGGSSVDIGYVLKRSLWRRGLMSEAAQFVVRWALSRPEVSACGRHATWRTCRRPDCWNPSA
jgi:ribosomal-protein-alanine N-acetyltransferase